MILSFGNKATERIWAGEHMSKFPIEIRELARRKLRMLHASKSIGDLVLPPSNRLEKLKGNLKEYHSIRINSQWRIIFKWVNGDAEDVEIIDYH